MQRASRMAKRSEMLDVRGRRYVRSEEAGLFKRTRTGRHVVILLRRRMKKTFAVGGWIDGQPMRRCGIASRMRRVGGRGTVRAHVVRSNCRLARAPTLELPRALRGLRGVAGGAACAAQAAITALVGWPGWLGWLADGDYHHTHHVSCIITSMDSHPSTHHFNSRTQHP